MTVSPLIADDENRMLKRSFIKRINENSRRPNQEKRGASALVMP